LYIIGKTHVMKHCANECGGSEIIQDKSLSGLGSLTKWRAVLRLLILGGGGRWGATINIPPVSII